MSLILKYVTSFIYVVLAGISSSLSSFNVGVFLFFDGFLLFLVVFFFDLVSLIFILRKKNSKKNNVKMSSLAKVVITTQYLLCA